MLLTANPTLPLIAKALVSVRSVAPSELYLVPPAIVSVPLPVIVPVYCRISPWFSEILPLWVPGYSRNVPVPSLAKVPEPVMLLPEPMPASTEFVNVSVSPEIAKSPAKYK